jgi:hypothetical protein
MLRLDEQTLNMTVVPAEYREYHNRIDNQVTEIQIYSEKVCRHIYRPDCPFTIEYSVWHKRARILKRMQRMIEGRVRQPGLLCQQACKLGIMKPRLWTLEQVQEGHQVCKAWKRELELYAPAFCFEHVRDLLIDAEAKGQSERVKILREQMSCEESRGMWGVLHYHFNTDGGRCNAVTRVDRIEDRVTVEYNQQEDIERVVREEMQARFSAAELSPFCQGLLGKELGYISDTATAAAILNHTYVIPDSVSDATALLIDEIGGQNCSGCGQASCFS